MFSCCSCSFLKNSRVTHLSKQVIATMVQKNELPIMTKTRYNSYEFIEFPKECLQRKLSLAAYAEFMMSMNSSLYLRIFLDALSFSEPLQLKSNL